MRNPGAEDGDRQVVVGGKQVVLREPAARDGRQRSGAITSQAAEGLARLRGRGSVGIAKVGPL
jgi:hypothetical protein